MKRSASAVWKGGLKDGKGTVSTESGVLSGTPYKFSNRFENEKGTNPGGAHRRGARRLFLDGAVALHGQRRVDAGKHRDHGGRDLRQRRRRLDHHRRAT